MHNLLLRLAFLALLIAAPTQHVLSQIKNLRQQNLSKWNIDPANYSGITMINDSVYAVVDDKSIVDGFFLMQMQIDGKSGRVKSIRRLPFTCAPYQKANIEKHRANADCEDIIFRHSTSTLWISQEENAEIVEYDMQGAPTGKKLAIPPFMQKATQQQNGGFEALGYDSVHHLFWITTENSLRCDSMQPTSTNQMAQPLRFLSFADNSTCLGQWLYLMEPSQLPTRARFYAHGVVAITALGDGRLLVMERELSIPMKYFGGKSNINIFIVSPSDEQRLPVQPINISIERNKFMTKTLLTNFQTHLSPIGNNYANYEGMCLGPILKDGRRTLLLINDSQAGAGNALYHLKDYIKVIILDKGVL